MKRKYPIKRVCKVCKIKYLQTRGDRGRYYCSPCGRANQKGKFGKESYAWKDGGFSYQGYRRLGTDKGRKLEHRYVMEQHLGRELGTKELVHHIDGDKTNNSLKNLKLISRNEHCKLHRPHQFHREKYKCH